MDQARQAAKSDDPRVKAALAEYMERVDRGEQVDREQFLAAHADIADELGSFITTSEELARLGSPSRRESEAQSVSTRSLAERDQETLIPDRVKGAPRDSQTTGLPEQFGRYKILKPLGSGAMGTVYLAEDTQLHRKVALKTPSFEQDETGELLERFYREARSAATIRHPHICPVFDVGEIGGRHYITMAYIEGRPLSAYIRPDKLQPERQTLVAIRKLALALQEAHDHNIIHRDLKPGNIMIDGKGEPIVMDFGLARKVHREEASRLTQSGMIVGSPAYMSPEQVEGDPDKLGPAADQYSLGVILYELLTGQLPFRGSVTAVIGAILTKEPTPVTELRKGVDPRIAALCARMMAKQARDRFPSMKAVAETIAGILKEAPGEAMKETVRTSAKPARSQSVQTAQPEKGAAMAAAASITASNVTSLFEAAQKCMRKHDYEQVVQMLQQIPEQKRTDEVRALLAKARQLADEVAFLLAEIDEAERVNDNAVLTRATDDLLKLKPKHHKALAIKEELSRYGKGKLWKPGGYTPDGRRIGEGSWIPWIGIAVGVIAFALATWAVTIYLKKGDAVVRVQITNPDVKVSFQGRTLNVKSANREFDVEAGENTLTITYGEATFETDKFTLQDGENPAVVVELLDKTLAAKFGELSIGEWPVDTPEAPTPTPESGDYQKYAQGTWTRLWDTDAAVQAAVIEGTPEDGTTLRNGVLHIRDGGVTGPWPSRNIAVRLKLKQEEGKGCFLSFRDKLGEPFMSYTNWANGYKNFGLGHNADGEFSETGGHAAVEDLRHGQFYEWMGVVDGETISIYVNGKRLLQMNDDRLQQGLFVLWAGDSEVAVRDAEYRILGGSTGSSSTPAVATSPVPADAEQFQGHSYKYFGETLSWKQAKQRCEQMGGHLPIVETAAENVFLTQLAERGFASALAGKEAVWLGATDEPQEGDWRWIDPSGAPAWGTGATYMNWFANQPNNKQQREHFATLWLSNKPERVSGQWTDQPNVALANEQTVHFVCEWDGTRSAAPAPVQAGWTDLFNGRDLTGWTVVGNAGEWTVVDGVLTSAPGTSSSGWLATDREFSDFELQIEYRLPDRGNSGVFLRIPEQGALNGGDFLEVQMMDDAAPGAAQAWQKTGSVYAVQGPSQPADTPMNQWHQMTIRAVGPEITIATNGREINRVNVESAPVLGPPKRDLKRPRGRIGLQRHATPVEFRNIRIRELSPATPPAAANTPRTAQPLPRNEWISLDPSAPRATSWNWGKPLKNPENKKWENGVLSLDNAAVAFNQVQAKDVSFRAKVRFLEGNNMALVVRGEHGKGGVYALFDKQNNGQMYVAFLNTNKSKVLALKDDYFDFQVDAIGDQVSIQVNGQTVVRHRETQKLKAGHIEVTAYNARGMFKEMAVKILDEAPAAAASQGAWTELFNGQHLVGWTRYADGQPVTSGWSVEDGAIRLRPPGGGDIMTADAYGDFELEFEWKIAEGGNSGVIYRSRSGDPLPWHSGHEYQVLDDDRHPNGKQATGSAGAIFNIAVPRNKALNPVGQWNSARIIARGNHLEHWLNGTRVAEVEIGSSQWTDAVAKSSFSQFPQFGTSRTGHIVLQDHGSEAWFRNLRIRTLP